MAETEQLRKIFVGGLNWATDEETMKNYFSHWGNIVDCVVMRTHDKTSRGFGFVTFDKAKCVDECLKERKHELDGRQIEPKRAVPRDETNNPSAHQKTKKIFIGGLASTTTEEDIEEYFNKLLHEFGEGRIVDIDLKRDRDNPKRIRGFAYVTFDSEEVVEKILIMKTHEIKMKHCEVKRAETQAAIRKKQERDGVRPTVHSSSSRENSRSGPATNSMNMAQNMQGFGMGNWNPGMLAGFFGGLGSGERGSGRPDMDGVNRGGAKSGGGGWGNADVAAGGNWGGPFGSNFNPGAMGFGSFGPGFGGFGPGFGFNPFAQLASMGYGAGTFGPGFGFGFGGGGFGPSAGSGDRGSSGGDSSRNVARGSADYGNDSSHDGKGVDSGTRDRSSAYPSITGYSNMMGQNWPVSYPGMAAAATVAAAAAAGGGSGGAVGDLKGASGTGTNHADAYPMGAYGQMNSSYGPSRTSGTWSVGSDSTNSNRMYKPY